MGYSMCFIFVTNSVVSSTDFLTNWAELTTFHVFQNYHYQKIFVAKSILSLYEFITRNTIGLGIYGDSGSSSEEDNNSDQNRNDSDNELKVNCHFNIVIEAISNVPC